MSAHTPGRLVLVDKAKGYFPPNVVLISLPNGYIEVGGAPSVREANARRLAACWNACEGMPTDDVEELADSNGVLVLVVYADELREQLATAHADSRAIEANYEAARALLAAVLKESDDNIAATVRAGGFLDAPPLAERIRQFLEPK